MSFFGGLKRILGWSSEEEDDDYITYGSSIDEVKTDDVKNESKEESCDDEIPEGLFDGLVEIVNANLSPMVLNCIDVEAEKKYLYNALGENFKDFVRRAKENGLSQARAEWEREKIALNSKIEDFKTRCESAEKDMSEMKAMKMSEDRQKLALKERVRNLEDQVATAEAEKEQYDLENKSLLNKLKVMQVKSGTSEDAEKEIQELTAQVVELKKKIAEGGADDEKVKQLEEEFNAKMEISNALVNELRSEAAKNKEELQNTAEELSASKAENEALKNEYEKVKEELDKASTELSELSENLGMLDDIQEQLEKVEEFKKKKEEEITALQDKVTTLEEEKAKALEQLHGEGVSRGRIAQLEMELSECKENLARLAQENTDTLALLHKKDEAYNAQKLELENVVSALEEKQSAYDALVALHESETNSLKVADVEKTKKFQAEIAELQAKLNVNGKIDDDLVDDDLRQAVEDTFDTEFSDVEFDDFSVEENKSFEVVQEDNHREAMVEEPEQSQDEVEAELDDIDWLLPDTVESVMKEEEEKKAKEQEFAIFEQEEPKSDNPDAQMSLFG